MEQSTLEHVRCQYKRLKGGMFKAEHKQFENFKMSKCKLDLRYCHEREVYLKNQVFLKFKAKFLQKIECLKLNGQSVMLKWLIHDWIDENIDEIWEHSVGIQKHFYSYLGCQSGFKSLMTDATMYKKRKLKTQLQEHADQII